MDTTPSLHKYEIVLINIHGARSNKANLESYLEEVNHPEVVCLNETKLPMNKNFELNGYNVIARREHSSLGGSRGSMILTRCDIMEVEEIVEVKNTFRHDEIIGICIKKTNERPGIKVFTYYNPPLMSPNSAIIEYISSIQDNCVLTGDLNCKNTYWGSTKNDGHGIRLLDDVTKNNLLLFNDGNKTRCDPVSGKEECLDLVIGNIRSSTFFKEFWIGSDVGSDHYPVHCVFQFKKAEYKSPKKVRNCDKINMTKWNRILREMPHMLSAKTPLELEQNAQEVTNRITQAFESSCPVTTIRKPAKCSFTPEIKNKVKEKRKLRREKNDALHSGNHIRVRQIMTRINRLGNAGVGSLKSF